MCASALSGRNVGVVWLVRHVGYMVLFWFCGDVCSGLDVASDCIAIESDAVRMRGDDEAKVRRVEEVGG